MSTSNTFLLVSTWVSGRRPHVSIQLPVTNLTALAACTIAAQKGGYEVRKARNNKLEISVKGKTKEGVLDVLTAGDRNSNQAMVNSMLYTFPGIRVVSEEHLPAPSDVYPITVSKALFNSAPFSTIPEDIHLNLDDLVVWIDPLDATKEYSEGLTQYVTTMVCVARKGEPLIGVIHQPFLSKTYWASKFGIDKKLLTLRSSFMTPSEQLRLIISRSHKGDVKKVAKEVFPNLSITEAAGSGYKVLELVKGHADIYLHTTYIKKWDICAPHAILKYATEGTMTTLRGEPLTYHFDSDSLHTGGVFATAKERLVASRQELAGKLSSV